MMGDVGVLLFKSQSEVRQKANLRHYRRHRRREGADMILFVGIKPKIDNHAQTHGELVKAGIAKRKAKAEAQGEEFHWGRPPIGITKDEPEIISKALRLRSQSASWTKISKELKVGRTTARRLCQKARAKEECVSGTSEPPVSDSGLENSSSPHQDRTHKRSKMHIGGDGY